jgi:septum formation protein
MMPASLPRPLLLASASPIRAALLRQAGLAVEVQPARVDEDAIRAALLADQAGPRDIADALAEAKASRVANRNPDRLVLGADQILALDDDILTKAATPDEAVATLLRLSGRTHDLVSAAVACLDGRPAWRAVGAARVTFHRLSADEAGTHVERHWDDIRHSVGCYRIEAEGLRLIAAVEGSYFDVLGLPLIPLLTWLRERGDITA